jgi:hypothetical protein
VKGLPEKVGRSLADHASDRSGFVIRVDRHSGHTSRPFLAGFAVCCARSALQVLEE